MTAKVFFKLVNWFSIWSFKALGKTDEVLERDHELLKLNQTI